MSDVYRGNKKTSSFLFYLALCHIYVFKVSNIVRMVSDTGLNWLTIQRRLQLFFILFVLLSSLCASCPTTCKKVMKIWPLDIEKTKQCGCSRKIFSSQIYSVDDFFKSLTDNKNKRLKRKWLEKKSHENRKWHFFLIIFKKIVLMILHKKNAIKIFSIITNYTTIADLFVQKIIFPCK